MTGSKSHFYKEFPKSCAPDDFWGQVKRTVGGQAIGQDQIDLMVRAVCEGLDLAENDVVLDLCCGNGALTDLIFNRCQGGLGVDFSEYLIEVAWKNFQREPHRRFVLEGVSSFVHSTPEASRFTKILCYGGIQYFTDEQAVDLLATLRSRFTTATRLFLGNIPDKDRIDAFRAPQLRPPGIESDPGTAIGIWRTQNEMASLAAKAGWRAAFKVMPAEFYVAHFRFDAVLTGTG